MLSLEYYQKVVFTMKQSKSGKHNGVDSKFFIWCRKYFKYDNTMGDEVRISLKDDGRINFIESYFAILKSIHEKTGHGRRDKMRHKFNQHYYWVRSIVIDLFLRCCVSCQLRKTVENPEASTAIISIGFMRRLQMDLIDLHTRLDKDFLMDTALPRSFC